MGKPTRFHSITSLVMIFISYLICGTQLKAEQTNVDKIEYYQQYEIDSQHLIRQPVMSSDIAYEEAMSLGKECAIVGAGVALCILLLIKTIEYVTLRLIMYYDVPYEDRYRKRIEHKLDKLKRKYERKSRGRVKYEESSN